MENTPHKKILTFIRITGISDQESTVPVIGKGRHVADGYLVVFGGKLRIRSEFGEPQTNPLVEVSVWI